MGIKNNLSEKIISPDANNDDEKKTVIGSSKS
jgi:hypothetical protein